jgi:hypothetical protein
MDDNYFCGSHCLARIVTGRGPLPHQVCYPAGAETGGMDGEEDDEERERGSVPLSVES